MGTWTSASVISSCASFVQDHPECSSQLTCWRVVLMLNRSHLSSILICLQTAKITSIVLDVLVALDEKVLQLIFLLRVTFVTFVTLSNFTKQRLLRCPWMLLT